MLLREDYVLVLSRHLSRHMSRQAQRSVSDLSLTVVIKGILLHIFLTSDY